MDMKNTLLAVSGLLGGSGGGGSGGPVITQQPSDVSGEIGVTVHFSVTASGAGLTYMWQSNMYEEWRDTSFSTSTTATLALKVAQERDGVQYRCKITDGEGHVVYSHPATLRVAVPEPVFITKTFTANGTYAASDDNADGYSEVTVNVPAGLVLLASGEYTAPSNVINMDIPVSYSGTPKFTMLVANEPPADTAQTAMAFLIPSFPVIGKTLSPNGFGGYVSRSATNALNHAVIGRGNSTFRITNTVLTFGRPAPSFPYIAGVTYQWYIYGEASA